MTTPEKRVCAGCKSYRLEFTRSETRCDRCTDPEKRKLRWETEKLDPEKHEKIKRLKREYRARSKAEALAQKQARLREIVVDFTAIPDIPEPRRVRKHNPQIRTKRLERLVNQVVKVCEDKHPTPVVTKGFMQSIQGNRALILEAVYLAISRGLLRDAGNRKGVRLARVTESTEQMMSQVFEFNT